MKSNERVPLSAAQAQINVLQGALYIYYKLNGRHQKSTFQWIVIFLWHCNCTSLLCNQCQRLYWYAVRFLLLWTTRQMHIPSYKSLVSCMEIAAVVSLWFILWCICINEVFVRSRSLWGFTCLSSEIHYYMRGVLSFWIMIQIIVT